MKRRSFSLVTGIVIVVAAVLFVWLRGPWGPDRDDEGEPRRKAEEIRKRAFLPEAFDSVSIIQSGGKAQVGFQLSSGASKDEVVQSLVTYLESDDPAGDEPYQFPGFRNPSSTYLRTRDVYASILDTLALESGDFFDPDPDDSSAEKDRMIDEMLQEIRLCGDPDTFTNAAPNP